jgi:hypothetical protein
MRENKAQYWRAKRAVKNDLGDGKGANEGRVSTVGFRAGCVKKQEQEVCRRGKQIRTTRRNESLQGLEFDRSTPMKGFDLTCKCLCFVVSVHPSARRSESCKEVDSQLGKGALEGVDGPGAGSSSRSTVDGRPGLNFALPLNLAPVYLLDFFHRGARAARPTTGQPARPPDTSLPSALPFLPTLPCTLVGRQQYPLPTAPDCSLSSTYAVAQRKNGVTSGRPFPPSAPSSRFDARGFSSPWPPPPLVRTSQLAGIGVPRTSSPTECRPSSSSELSRTRLEQGGPTDQPSRPRRRRARRRAARPPFRPGPSPRSRRRGPGRPSPSRSSLRRRPASR